jgi:hypothetical protein
MEMKRTISEDFTIVTDGIDNKDPTAGIMGGAK